MICGACGLKVVTEVDIFPRLPGTDARTVYALGPGGIALHDEVCSGDGIFGYEPEEIAAAVSAIAEALRG